MATWKETEKQRDDDPYHAWAYHKALSERRGKKSKTLCAVVIELKAHNGATDGLVKALLALLTILLSKRELATILDALKRPELMGAVPARGVLSGEGAGRRRGRGSGARSLPLEARKGVRVVCGRLCAGVEGDIYIFVGEGGGGRGGTWCGGWGA